MKAAHGRLKLCLLGDFHNDKLRREGKKYYLRDAFL